ncbi:integrating conjugative element protein, partial [Salmonella enterica subsp. diarizonae]|nr:integrating conjugative element protein [Salmonella enterica subsp. diarizonae]
VDSLDRGLETLKNEMELRRAITSNSLLKTLERQEIRNSGNQLMQKGNGADEKMGGLEQKEGER